VALVVDGGPPGLRFSNVDVGFVAVTICAPGTNNCQTIDHIAVDTGSTGLRVTSGALNATLAAALPQQRDAGSNPLAQCTLFADGSVFWGSVRVADLKLGGERASSIPIQVIGDPSIAVPPSACSGTLEQTTSDIGANGLLGVSNFLQDCGAFCAARASNGIYFGCGAAGCVSVAVPTSQQLLHPVSRFAQDNNGVLIQLPAVSAAGAESASGSLIFGIGTQANNALGTARVFTVDSVFGLVNILNGGASYVNSFVDSGSNVYWIPSSINNQPCPATGAVAGFLCPSPPLSLSLTIAGQNGASAVVPVNVGNAQTLFSTNPSATAFDNLGAPNSDPNGVVIGLPFFLGRNVFTAIEGRATPGGAGPYVAF